MSRLDPAPAVNCSYGAPLGRASDHLSALIVTERVTPFRLQHVPLDSGGCDPDAYYSRGVAVYK